MNSILVLLVAVTFNAAVTVPFWLLFHVLGGSESAKWIKCKVMQFNLFMLANYIFLIVVIS